MDVVASQASRDFEYTEDHALRVKDFAHTINMSSIGRDLDIDELQAPDLLLLYPVGQNGGTLNCPRSSGIICGMV